MVTRRAFTRVTPILAICVGCGLDADRATLEAMAYGAILDELEQDPATIHDELLSYGGEVYGGAPEGIDAAAWEDLKRVSHDVGPMPIPEDTSVEVVIVHADLDLFDGLTFSRVGLDPDRKQAVAVVTEWHTTGGQTVFEGVHGDLTTTFYPLRWTGRHWKVREGHELDVGTVRLAAP